MKHTVLRYVFDRAKKSSKTVQGLLQIEVRLEKTNKLILISTGIRLYKNQFSDKNGFTCINHDKPHIINKKVRDMYNDIESFANSDKCVSLSDVKKWNKDETYTYSVLAFMREQLKRKSPTMNMAEYHNKLINKVETFGKIKVFADLTLDNIELFDVYLRKTIKSQPVLYKRHCAFKKYIETAIAKGYCNYNPYVDFIVKKGKSKDPTFLIESEIEIIKQYAPKTERMQKVRDLFLFQCFTGMAYVDVMQFDKSMIQMLGGKEVFRSSRQKTNESFISLLLPDARSILEKYNYNLPKITNQKYNDYLHIMEETVQINKSITSHTARHNPTHFQNNINPLQQNNFH